MENVILVILLIIAVALVGVVLLQRSEGGGLGLGGGGGGGSVMSGRAAANALTRLTWILGAAFFAASLAMTVIAARKAAENSVLDRVAPPPAAESGEPAAPSIPLPPAGDDLLPPGSGADNSAPQTAPQVPPTAPAGPATPPIPNN